MHGSAVIREYDLNLGIVNILNQNSIITVLRKYRR